MEINDLIFKELIKRGYYLEGKTRIWNLADSKLWYLTSNQAQGFLNLEKTQRYKISIIDKEVSLIKKNLKKIIKSLSFNSCNFIDLGCGNGKKASLFIEELSKHLDIRYCPIDISSYMVSKAAKTIRKLKISEVLEFKWNISDFENLNNVTPLFRGSKYKNHFMILLGNTLGNFDREDILHGIKNSMEKKDILLIGNGISNGKNKKWIKDYKDEKINKWLVQVPKLIGLTEKNLKYDVRFVNSRIEEIYIVKNNKTINHLNKSVSFNKGDIIIVAISYKYNKKELKKILSKFFSKVKIYTDKKESYALVLCNK